MSVGAIGGHARFNAYYASSPARQVGQEQLSLQEQQQVQKLKATDQKVRQHEAAHQAAGAGLTGAANYQYVRGPDGRQYAVGGEVSINVSSGGTPEQTLARARQIQAAALAPADPSSQDRAVAAQAAQMALQAQAELSEKKQAEGVSVDTPGSAGTSAGAADSRVEASAQNASADHADSCCCNNCAARSAYSGLGLAPKAEATFSLFA